MKAKDWKREIIEPYKGVYTTKEIELNRKLYEAACGEKINFAEVEELLKQGADPLGGIEEDGLDLLEHPYGTIAMESWDYHSVELPRLTELFLKYGMDIDNPRVPYDASWSLNPLWSFAFSLNENSIKALKMLLDKGVSADSFGALWGHAVTDLCFVYEDPATDDFMNKECTWAMKTLMLGASYPHILENDSSLREFIRVYNNEYDLERFRKWDDFYYEYDTSHCIGSPQFERCIININERESGKRVWRYGICIDPQEYD